MRRRGIASGSFLVLAIATSLLASASAPAASGASWKRAEFVFTGEGKSSYVYPPGRVGKKQTFTMTWRIAWRLVPNTGDAKTVSEKIDGASRFTGTLAKDSCSGGIEKQKNVLAPLTPLPGGGKKALLGASVPMFNYLAYVPRCAGRPGEAAVASYFGPGPYALHKLAHAEVAFDAANPKSVKLAYSPDWKGKGPQGDTSTISWSGTLEVRVIR
jgi:hypothetical protein